MIKKAKNGKMLQFLTVKLSGFNLQEIADGILLWETDVNKIARMGKNKMMKTFEQGFLDKGFMGLEFGDESLTDYDEKIKIVKKLILNHFPNLEE